MKIEDPRDVIRRAIDAEMDPEDDSALMKSLEFFYSMVNFNEEAKLGLLSKEALNVSYLADFSIQDCATKYKSFNTAILQFQDCRTEFCSATVFNLSIGTYLKTSTSTKDSKVRAC